MSVNVPFNGTTYIIPTSGETGWANQVTNFIVDVGANALTSTSSGTITNKAILLPVGAVGTPSLSFIPDTVTGLYQPATGQLAIATNGVQTALFSQNTVTVNAANTITLGTNSLPQINIIPNTITLSTGGATAFTIGTTANTSALPIVLPADPTTALQACTKQYVDAKVPAAMLPLAGGTLTGHLYMATNPPALPGNVGWGAMLSTKETIIEIGGHLAWNSLIDNTPKWVTRAAGYSGQEWIDPSGNRQWALYPSLAAGANCGSATGTMTLSNVGMLTTNGKAQHTQAIIAVAGANPTVTCWNTGSGNAMGMWQNASALNFGNTDGAGNPTVSRMILDGGSNLLVNGAVYYGYGNFTSAYLTADANNTWITVSPNYAIQFRRSDGAFLFTSPSASGNCSMSISNTGNVSIPGSLSATGNVNMSSAVCSNVMYPAYTLAAGYYLNADGSNNFINWLAGWRDYFQRSDGSHQRERSSAIWETHRAGDALIYNSIYVHAGIGTYINVSDARTKSDIVDSQLGMSTIRKLRPIEFTRIPRDKGYTRPDGQIVPAPEPRRELGFDAHELREHVPQAVVKFGLELEDGTGGLDSDNPTLGIQEAQLLPIVVRALQEINERLLVVEALMSERPS